MSNPIDLVSAQLTDIHRSLDEDARKRDRQILMLKVASVLLALGVLAGVWAGLSARRATEASNRTRAEARVASCQRDNEKALQINALGAAMGGIVDLVNVPNPNRTAEQQAALDRFLAASHAKLDAARIEYRDCTPEGIDAYLSTTSTTEEP